MADLNKIKTVQLLFMYALQEKLLCFCEWCEIVEQLVCGGEEVFRYNCLENVETQGPYEM